MKLSTLSILVLFGVVLGSVGYMLGSLAVVGTSGTQVARSASTGPGSVYDTPVPVADFTLTDQTGAKFTFSSTRGKVVLMAFLYTHCGDVCPFSAAKMRLALQQLGESSKDVELVAISTDPERDTVPQIAAYSKALGLYDLWHMVTGPLPEMRKLYASLKITVLKAERADVEDTVKNAADVGITLPTKDADSPLFGLTDQQILDTGKVAKQFAGGYDIAHSAPFWVVDRSGNVRTSLDVSASPVQLVEAIKAYLKG
jgi:protein SCO1/2